VGISFSSGRQKPPERAQGGLQQRRARARKQEQEVHEELKQVWAASAVVEKLELEIDRAESILAEAVGEALKAGTDARAVRAAAGLAPAELSDLTETPRP
jgi:hypothetical protein